MKKRIVWWSSIIALIAATIFSFRYFPRAFPLVSVDITMNRTQALAAARTLASQFNWQPQQSQQTAAFELDSETRNYVELEAGGNEAFKRVLEEKIYYPYFWQVRHFQESVEEETTVIFTPDGIPYGFQETIAETTPGAALTSQEARQIAEAEAATHWHINFADYDLIESSKKEHPSNRIDHNFVYELRDKKIAEATYRLSLVVSGDKLTQLKHYIFIPESFSRKFRELRAANNTLAYAATLWLYLVYIFIGALGGLALFMRKRFVITKPAIIAGGVLALLQLLAQLNSLPLIWFEYDTAVALYTFLANYLVSLVTSTIYTAIIYTLSIMAAETFTRATMHTQPQTWQWLSLSALSSAPLRKRLLIGYMAVPFLASYIVGFYALFSPLFKWWTPSDMLVDPNVLSSYFPWFSPIARSLNAGVWEEALFRAVPLAGCILVGEYLGFRRTLLVIGFIMQSIVFSAAHANYPGFPFYIRLVELLVPSCMFGILYLRVGLVPAMVVHTLYDIVWFSLPIFASSAPGTFTAKIFIIALSFLPLIMAYARYLLGMKSTMPDQNQDWQPPQEQPIPDYARAIKVPQISTHTRWLIALAGLAGLLVWIFATPRQQDAPPLALTRQEALEKAHNIMQARNIDTTAWQARTLLINIPIADNRYVWQAFGKEAYKKLTGSYIMPPLWEVRFVKTTGPVAERAEEYHVWIDGNTLYRFEHILPEHTAGAQLGEQEARSLAQDALQNNLHLAIDDLKEISAQSTKQPERLDWQFEYEDNTFGEYPDLKPRIVVKIAGNEVVDINRYLFTPESWRRDERNKETMNMIINLIAKLIAFFLTLYGIYALGFTMTLRRFNKNKTLLAGLIIIGATLLHMLNALPVILSSLNTMEPITNQLFIIFASLLLRLIIYSLPIAFLLGLRLIPARVSDGTSWLMGIASGSVVIGFSALINQLLPLASPILVPNMSANTYLPFIGSALQFSGTHIISNVLGAWFLLLSISYTGWLGLPLSLALATLIIPASTAIFFMPWLCKIIALAIVAWLVARYAQHNATIVVAGILTIQLNQIILEMIMNTWPGAILNGLINIVVILATAFLVLRYGTAHK